jgi:hypothetical protein
MKDHAVIEKFMGICPSEKALMVWEKSRWKVKGEMDLNLGYKGFFTLFFSCTEDREKYLMRGLTSSTRLEFILDIGRNDSHQRKRTT